MGLIEVIANDRLGQKGQCCPIRTVLSTRMLTADCSPRQMRVRSQIPRAFAAPTDTRASSDDTVGDLKKLSACQS